MKDQPPKIEKLHVVKDETLKTLLENPEVKSVIELRFSDTRLKKLIL